MSNLHYLVGLVAILFGTAVIAIGLEAPKIKHPMDDRED